MKETEVRTGLAGLDPELKYKFLGTFVKESVDRRFPDKGKMLLTEILLVDEDDNTCEITDHIWVSKSKRWNQIINSIKPGDTIEFMANVGTYQKEGKREFYVNYNLQNLRSIKIKDVQNVI